MGGLLHLVQQGGLNLIAVRYFYYVCFLRYSLVRYVATFRENFHETFIKDGQWL